MEFIYDVSESKILFENSPFFHLHYFILFRIEKEFKNSRMMLWSEGRGEFGPRIAGARWNFQRTRLGATTKPLPYMPARLFLGLVSLIPWSPKFPHRPVSH